MLWSKAVNGPDGCTQPYDLDGLRLRSTAGQLAVYVHQAPTRAACLLRQTLDMDDLPGSAVWLGSTFGKYGLP